MQQSRSFVSLRGGFSSLAAIAGGCALLALLLFSAGLPARAELAPAYADIVAECRADLAERLKIKADDVKTVEVKAKTWPDAALGMPEPGMAYAQVVTGGWRIVLEGQGARYLYVATLKAFKYGGPLLLWEVSTLYTLPVENEPNLNGDLYQCSMAGTNDVRVATGVSAYFPQGKGMILFTRRASRSGVDLFLIKAEKGAKAKPLYSAFFVGAAALNDAQDRWAAFVRPGVGGGWQLAVGEVGKAGALKLALPEGMPDAVVWEEGQLLIAMKRDKGILYFAANPLAAKPEWKAINAYSFPGAMDMVLNKSETLEIVQAGTPEKPAVEVARVWFTGDRKLVATIEGLTLRSYRLIGAGYAFISGTRDGKTESYAVHIYTGVTLRGLQGMGQDPQPFAWPPLNRP